MTASIAILCAAVVLVALVVRDVFVRALAAQVRKAELAVEEAREAEVASMAKRLDIVEVDCRNALSAIQIGKVARR